MSLYNNYVDVWEIIINKLMVFCFLIDFDWNLSVRKFVVIYLYLYYIFVFEIIKYF